MGAPERTWLGGIYNHTDNAVNWVSGDDVTFNRLNPTNGELNKDTLFVEFDQSNPSDSMWGRTYKGRQGMFICE